MLIYEGVKVGEGVAGWKLIWLLRRREVCIGQWSGESSQKREIATGLCIGVEG